MPSYPHHLLITTPGEGGELVEDPEAGILEDSSTPVIIYEGRADVQDAGESVVRGQDQVTHNSEAVVFLQDESKITLIKSGMTCTITWNPDGDGTDQEDAVVERVTRLDGTFGIRRL